MAQKANQGFSNRDRFNLISFNEERQSKLFILQFLF